VDVADEDVILADKDIHQLARADWVNGVRDCVRDDQPGSGSQMGISSLDWKEQYQKMSLDDRLQLELSSIGLLPVQPVSEEFICHFIILQSTISNHSFFCFPPSGILAFICGLLSSYAINSYECNLTCLVLLSAISGTSMSWSRMKSAKS